MNVSTEVYWVLLRLSLYLYLPLFGAVIGLVIWIFKKLESKVDHIEECVHTKLEGLLQDAIKTRDLRTQQHAQNIESIATLKQGQIDLSHKAERMEDKIDRIIERWNAYNRGP